MKSPQRADPRPKRSFRLIATVVVLVLAALAVAVPSSGNKHKADGVRADVKHGMLRVKGSNRDDAVALRLKAGDPTRVQVDVGDDGSADFSLDRSRLSAIELRMGGGDDSARIDDANGAFTDTIPRRGLPAAAGTTR
jgi:hypothetical protein